jgi:hypothetical protein
LKNIQAKIEVRLIGKGKRSRGRRRRESERG